MIEQEHAIVSGKSSLDVLDLCTNDVISEHFFIYLCHMIIILLVFIIKKSCVMMIILYVCLN
jgi:hypothetical protein